MRKRLLSTALLTVAAGTALFGQVTMRVYTGAGNYNDFEQVDSIVWIPNDIDPSDPTDTTTVKPFMRELAVNLSCSNWSDAEEILIRLYKNLSCFSSDSTDLWYADDWGLRTNWLMSTHPTLDTQASGWDRDFNTQKYSVEDETLATSWKHCYKNIGVCNKFQEALEGLTDIPADTKEHMIGEVCMLRGFFYMFLAQNWGAVLPVNVGEDASATINRERLDIETTWDMIISDFQIAEEKLTWAPRNTAVLETLVGSMTKGAALAYLADAYLWKAKECPDSANDCYTKAKEALEKVINSGEYALNESYTTLWDQVVEGSPYNYNKEAIFTQYLVEGNSWMPEHTHQFISFYAACPENGGWGTLSLSWEWYASFENGDKRRDASAVTGNIENMAQYGIEPSNYCHGKNPYTDEQINGELSCHFQFDQVDRTPSIWSLKYWRNGKASWSDGSTFKAANIYWKRYANVLLDYAECCFLTGNEAKGWEYVDMIRKRAFGNLEVGKKSELEQKYLPLILERTGLESYPLPFNTQTVEVPSAKDYYTDLCNTKNYNAPVWKVAVNEERRKEFNAEYCLGKDMIRSGYAKENIATNYPMRFYSEVDCPWSQRDFDYATFKEYFPIPQGVIDENHNCIQNPGF